MSDVRIELSKSIDNLNFLVSVMNDLINELHVDFNENRSCIFTLIQEMEARDQDDFIDRFCSKLEISDAVSKSDPRFFECRKNILNMAKNLEVVANRTEALFDEIVYHVKHGNVAIKDLDIEIIKNGILETKISIRNSRKKCLELDLT